MVICRGRPRRPRLDAAIHSGAFDLAQALLNERLTVRPSSVFGWMQQARVLGQRGDVMRADAATGTAAVHRTRFAAVIPDADTSADRRSA